MELFARCAAEEVAGGFDYEKGYSAKELKFLKSIGYKKREFYDFVEDHVAGDDPSPHTALLVAAVRRDYFLVEQGGQWSEAVICRDDIPSKQSELDGIVYFPRILAKARAKLRGELDPDLMFGCGGDRRFLRENGGLHPADFLRRVWAAGNDDRKVADWIKSL
ncbi:MAG: DUF5069 domain-containing protein [Luteolibacter sp.]